MTLTEQRLIKMWTATDFGGDFFELNKTLHQIAMVMQAEGLHAVAEDFSTCAGVALQRAVMDIAERKMKVAA